MQACEGCLKDCLNEADVSARIRCIELLSDCAEICFVAARFMSRNSGFSKQICDLCAQICDACASECEKFQDQHCKSCAKICRQCAQECRNMLVR